MAMARPDMEFPINIPAVGINLKGVKIGRTLVAKVIPTLSVAFVKSKTYQWCKQKSLK